MRAAQITFLLLLLVIFGVTCAHADEVVANSSSVTIPSGATFHCNVVTIDLTGGRVVPRLIYAKEGVGRTESFLAMLKRAHALAGINGSFFDAYNKVGDKDPGMTLITGGNVIHKGGTGTVVGFWARGIVMGKLDLPIKGTVTVAGKRPQLWYAYWLNRTPTSSDNIAVFTPARGARARVNDGISVVVQDNQVVRITHGDAAIPKDGFVINFRGDSAPEAAKFALGAIVNYSVARKAERDEENWQYVQEAVGAGPRLITDGRITYAPESEGFSSPKILSNRGRRSAIGVTHENRILLVTVDSPTVAELAQVMLKLGCVQAMNLDGGASSCLYCKGNMITPAGRELSNALVFVHQ